MTTSRHSFRHNGVELQPRDFELLADLFDTRFITIRHAAALHFGGGEDVAKQRLLKLHKAGLVHRREMNLAGPRGVRSLYVFRKRTLDLLLRHGWLLRCRNENWNVRLRKRFEAISPLTIQHELGLLDVRAALEPTLGALAHIKVIRFGVWPLEHEFYVRRGDRRVRQRPDGYLCFAEHSPLRDRPAYRHFYIEYDRGTESLETIAIKAEGYRNHHRTGGFCRWLGRPGDQPRDNPFRVLFIAPSAGRIRSMLARLGQAGERRRAWLTTLDELTADPLGAIWVYPQALIESGGRLPEKRWGLLDDPSGTRSPEQTKTPTHDIFVAGNV
jgi:hypothetical protein